MNTVQKCVINPAFAGYFAQHLREATGDLHRVFDNLLDIANGDDPNDSTYDWLRATRILSDRGFGKVTKNRPQTTTDHHSPKDTSPSTPGYTPDLVRDSQYYVLEITDYGAKLAAILISIHEADPDDESVGSWHRVTAGQMIIDRVLGSAVDLAQTTDRPIDPTEEPDWMLKHPADIDSEATPEELMKAGRATREIIQDYRQQIASCEDCTDEDLCDEHYMDEDAMLMSARVFRTMQVVGNRIYFELRRRRHQTPPPRLHRRLLTYPGSYRVLNRGPDCQIERIMAIPESHKSQFRQLRPNVYTPDNPLHFRALTFN